MGRVKEVLDTSFLIRRARAPDLRLLYDRVLATPNRAEDYRGGPPPPPEVVLSVRASDLAEADP
jgi:hypothetical protein